MRVNDSLLSGLESKVLDRLCRAMPRWITSDMLTLAGVVGAGLAFVGYWRSSSAPEWLWLANAGIVLNWLGDSLDGTLARFRKLERPRYGFFLDHMTDAVAMGLVAIGIGLSPYAMLASGLAILCSYYLMTILAMVTCAVTGVLKISFNGVGPSEIRLLIVICTCAALVTPTPRFTMSGVIWTIYDAIMIALSALLVAACVVEAFRTGRVLAAEDPPQG